MSDDYQSITTKSGWNELEDVIYCNLDHRLNLDTAVKLKTIPNTYAQHAAWNFCGLVFWDGSSWVEEVWQYRMVSTHTDNDLSTLIEAVNNEYGHE